MKPVDKILGADVELGNMIEHTSSISLSNDFAARLLLAEIDGIPSVAVTDAGRTTRDPLHAASGGAWLSNGYGLRAPGVATDTNPQDWGRKFLATNGSCAYIDLGHLEVCQPEVRSAHDFVSYHEAGLALARSARAAAQTRLYDDERLVVMANNTDRMGNAWGSHLNVLVTRELFDRIFGQMYPDLFVLAAWQVSSILFTGQGKVGSENGMPAVPFQLTQRGDFCECITGEQTTFRRPIVNSRDEAHCGPEDAASALARLHVIFHDTTLTHTSNFLKAGVSQTVLALLETGWNGHRTMLENPLLALRTWGHDPDLRAVAPLIDGRRITAIDHQRLFLEPVKRFVAAGDADCVPDAERIVALWEDTLDRLERNDTAVLARRLDWVLKRELLARAIDRNPGLSWESPAIRAADLRFASLDSDGLFHAVAAAGGVDELVTPAQIDLATREPPEDTRAWTRAMLLRAAGRRGVEGVNWDHVRLRPSRPGGASRVIRLDDPRRFGRAECEQHFTASPMADSALGAHTTPINEGER